MFKKMRSVIFFLIIYMLTLWIGFRLGECYYRMKTKVRVEKIQIVEKVAPHVPYYYIVERRDYGTYSSINFEMVNQDSVVMRFFFNKNLKPLLKLRDIEIYNSDGEKLY